MNGTRVSDATDDEIRHAKLEEDDARLVYAREHGFENWNDLASRVDALQHGRGYEPFMAAYKALERRDLSALRMLLRAHPNLATARACKRQYALESRDQLGKPCEPNRARLYEKPCSKPAPTRTKPTIEVGCRFTQRHTRTHRHWRTG